MATSNKSLVAIVLTAVFVAAAGATAALLLLGPSRAPAAASGLPDLDPSPDNTGLPILFPAPTFDLTNENGTKIPSASLQGSPYVAAFVFTNCTSICPAMSGKMSSLQSGIPDKRVKLVSFTVDPDRDTPDVLKKYAEKFGADESRWFFLTGTKPQMTQVESGFHVHLPREEASNNNGPEHSDRFILVDKSGQVRAVYDSKDEVSMAALKRDAAILANK